MEGLYVSVIDFATKKSVESVNIRCITHDVHSMFMDLRENERDMLIGMIRKFHSHIMFVRQQKQVQAGE